ncbi:MAG: ATP cone domain-containing protein [Candidatus Aenigmatarchaeota archaeon]
MEFGIKIKKRDGKVEDFIVEKIVVSILRSGADIKTARKIAYIVLGKILEKNKKEISTKELTKIVLNLLKKENFMAYKNWIIFNKYLKKKRKEFEKKLSKNLLEYLKKK